MHAIPLPPAQLILPRRPRAPTGDNRNVSVDSHIWGCLSVDNVVGKAFYVLYPVERCIPFSLPSGSPTFLSAVIARFGGNVIGEAHSHIERCSNPSNPPHSPIFNFDRRRNPALVVDE